MYHLDEQKLFFSDRQHASRKSHICEPQLATLIDDWAKVLDSQGRVSIETLVKVRLTHLSWMLKKRAFDTPPYELSYEYENS